MIPVMCMVQEGQIPPEKQTSMRADIAQFTLRTFGAPANIDWIVVSRGSGFSGAKPSTSVITTLQANRVLDQEERFRLLKELGEICMANTNRSPDEIVTSIRDPR